MVKFHKVLLVDDDEVSNFITTEILNTNNLADHILVANNGQEALDLIHSTWVDSVSKSAPMDNIPQLIFLDLNMPIMDGFEFLQACEDRCQDKKIDVVVLTSSTNENDIESTRKFSQVKYYLSKPLTADKLEQAMNHI